MVRKSLRPEMVCPTAIDLPSGKRVHVKAFAPHVAPWAGDAARTAQQWSGQ